VASSGAVQLGSTRREKPLPPGSPWYKHLWRGWKRVGLFIGTLISRVVTSIIYFVAVTPFAIGVRFFSDPLELKPGPARTTPLPPPAGLEGARQGF